MKQILMPTTRSAATAALGLIMAFGFTTATQAGIGGGGGGYSPVGGCPGGDGAAWVLAPTSIASESDVGNNSDQNGDGFSCFRVNKGLTKKQERNNAALNIRGVFVIKDNTNKLTVVPQ